MSAMQWHGGVEKEVILTTRDFTADSWCKDGTDFRVQVRYGTCDVRAIDWFDAHRFDHYRGAFRPDDEDADESPYLQCHDETEALSIILSLQRELNEALT